MHIGWMIPSGLSWVWGFRKQSSSSLLTLKWTTYLYSHRWDAASRLALDNAVAAEPLPPREHETRTGTPSQSWPRAPRHPRRRWSWSARVPAPRCPSGRRGSGAPPPTGRPARGAAASASGARVGRGRRAAAPTGTARGWRTPTETRTRPKKTTSPRSTHGAAGSRSLRLTGPGRDRECVLDADPFDVPLETAFCEKALSKI